MQQKKEKSSAKSKEFVNDLKSPYGFQNVGELKSFTSIGGSGVEGTVQPKKSDFNEYMSVFGQYGSKAGDMIVDKITRDMSGRGFKVRKSENKKQMETDNGNFKPVYNKKTFKWEVKETNASGLKRENDNVANTLLKNWKKSKGKGGK